MQQLQENIKKDLIKHPFRNIEVIYEADKTTLSPQDEELLAAYTSLHDFELEMKNTATTLYRESVTLNESIDLLREELKRVNATFDDCRTLADKLSAANYVFEESNLEKLAQRRDHMQMELKDYHEKILSIYETAKVLQEKINQYNEVNEKKIDPEYDKFITLTSSHLANWENNSINAVVFDEQFDQFRDFRTRIESDRETLMIFCQEALTNYTNLNLETTGLYNVWNEFIKRCDLLVAMSDLNNKATGFTEN
jgi:hypothetical protein